MKHTSRRQAARKLLQDNGISLETTTNPGAAADLDTPSASAGRAHVSYDHEGYDPATGLQGSGGTAATPRSRRAAVPVAPSVQPAPQPLPAVPAIGNPGQPAFGPGSTIRRR